MDADARATTEHSMPEGDSIHRAARSLQALVGERVEVETPHPRARVLSIAGRLDGRRLERVEAVGKNLLLHFEGGVILRSHLRMNGRWWPRSNEGSRTAGEAYKGPDPSSDRAGESGSGTAYRMRGVSVSCVPIWVD